MKFNITGIKYTYKSYKFFKYDRMNKRLKEHKNEWTNACMNERTNERMTTKPIHNLTSFQTMQIPGTSSTQVKQIHVQNATKREEYRRKITQRHGKTSQREKKK